MTAARDLNREFADTEARKYAYDFDYRMHGYMLRAFEGKLPAGRALEMGCFEGEFTKRLAAIYEDLTTVEGSSDLIAVARTAAPARVSFVLSRFEDFQPAQPFDAIFLTHTLEHLDEPVEMLRRIGTWLAPTGRLFVVVPNANAASRQIAVAMGLISHPTAVTPGEFDHGHRRTYDLPALAAHVHEAGLRAVETGGVFFKPFANFQLDKLLASGAIGEDYLEGCFKLGGLYPDLCASIYAICAAPGAGDT
ncbi:MAG TPA: class I SAM-dependent methyltransferase [Phenylobacterium sp.]|jgi:2-polyprenyl-3-methyl-5-hydroxy-6-metoxy-1,4-benzoquinol methylase|uniref:class I SAM-dependent methyltransferase n=1 Tax=Phenylobacterium sp. TaxID=1871053 RepID=UPI002B7C6310|nr:class I SAM-dependent methyltransferase [Phenylobacterium sp.]HXA41123.1 class I SAM-dependent methyltransferase [Phenylobacterium sp.]